MNKELYELTLKISSVSVFKNVTESEPIKKLVHYLCCTDSQIERLKRYSDFINCLYPHGGDLGSFLRAAVLEDENAYIVLSTENKAIPSVLESNILKELDIFTYISKLDPNVLKTHIDYNGYIPDLLNTSFNFKTGYMKKFKKKG